MNAGPYPTKVMFEALKTRVTDLEARRKLPPGGTAGQVLTVAPDAALIWKTPERAEAQPVPVPGEGGLALPGGEGFLERHDAALQMTGLLVEEVFVLPSRRTNAGFYLTEYAAE